MVEAGEPGHRGKNEARDGAVRGQTCRPCRATVKTGKLMVCESRKVEHSDLYQKYHSGCHIENRL